MKPAVLKDIAFNFAKEHYPRFHKETGAIWRMLEETRFDKTAAQESIRQGRGLGLAFGREADPELIEMISRTVVFFFTYKDIRDKEDVSKAELFELMKQICSLLKNELRLQRKSRKHNR